MVSWDLRDGFYAVGIAEEDRDYLTIEVSGFGLLRFAALPMGLTCSPFVFTKVIRTFVRALRGSPPLAPSIESISRPSELPRLPARARLLVLHRARRATPQLQALLRDAPASPELGSLFPRFRRLMQEGLRLLPWTTSCCWEAALEARDYVQAVLDLLGLRRHALWTGPMALPATAGLACRRRQRRRLRTGSPTAPCGGRWGPTAPLALPPRARRSSCPGQGGGWVISSIGYSGSQPNNGWNFGF